MDVIGSGPEREPWTPVRSALRAARAPGASRAAYAARPDNADNADREPAREAGGRPGRGRRVVGGAVAVVVAAGAMLALRAGTEPIGSYGAAAAPPSTVAPPTGYARVRLQPPYDHLPGRTPIPDPIAALDRRTLTGPLPRVTDGRPGETAATSAARLVLGRYCRRPWAFTVTMEPRSGWQQVRAKASRTVPRRIFLDLRLRWDAPRRAYEWTGAIAQLDTCS